MCPPSNDSGNRIEISGSGTTFHGPVAVGDGATSSMGSEADTSDSEIRGVTPTEKRIFISHAHRDDSLTAVLIELLRSGCGLATTHIFAASTNDHRISVGSDYLTWIKRELVRTPLGVAIVTENYLLSEFCMAELGALWASDTDLFPLIDPRLETTNDILSSIICEPLTSSGGLDLLRARVSVATGVPVIAVDRWITARSTFIDSIVRAGFA